MRHFNTSSSECQQFPFSLVDNITTCRRVGYLNIEKESPVVIDLFLSVKT